MTVFKVVDENYLNTHPGWEVKEIVVTEREVLPSYYGGSVGVSGSAVGPVTIKETKYLVFTSDPDLIEVSIKEAGMQQVANLVQEKDTAVKYRDEEIVKLKKQLERSETLLAQEQRYRNLTEKSLAEEKEAHAESDRKRHQMESKIGAISGLLGKFVLTKLIEKDKAIVDALAKALKDFP